MLTSEGQDSGSKLRGIISSSSLTCLLFLVACSDSVPPPMVVANGETLEGLWEGENGSIAAFKGVPFAAPPVGDLRWRTPLPNTPRTGRQDATEFAPGCMQTTYSTDWYARVAAAFGHKADVAGRPNGVSEDCLYLNIWTPALDASRRDDKLPVFVWFHGGSNKGGWSYEPNYIGAELAKRGLVVVTVTYRLGPFGFFSHPALDNGEGEPIANFGWVDAYRAFDWVTENIQAFGGDPDNITAFGESSGAGDISDWAAAELAEDKVARRSIAQSPGGSIDERPTLADEQETGKLIIDSLGIRDEITAKRLREIPAEDLQVAAASALPGHYYDVVLDGLTLKERPIDSLDSSKTSAIDFLLGTNADEWYMYLDENTTMADLEAWVDENAPEHKAALLAEVDNETDPRRALDRLRTAKETLCPVRYFAGKISEKGGRAWVYYFSRQRSGPGGEKLGAYHGTEISYVFGTHDEWLPTEEIDLKLTDAIMDYWVQFARTGDPNLKGRPGWPQYIAERPYVMELGEEIRVMEAHDQELCRYFDQQRDGL